jgi:hypothetical protein
VIAFPGVAVLNCLSVYKTRDETGNLILLSTASPTIQQCLEAFLSFMFGTIVPMMDCNNGRRGRITSDKTS